MIASATPILQKDIFLLSQLHDRHRPATKSNVLLAGINKEELDVLSRFLTDTYQLFIASSAGGVMKIIETNSIHLVVANTELSDADGSQLCSRLKSSDQYAHIPVILLIDKDIISSRLKGLEAGADAYIEKPLFRQIIRAQVNNVITNRTRIKNYFAHTLFAHMDTTTKAKTDQGFIKRLDECIAENLPDRYFDVDRLAKHLNMSRPTLYRKVKCISDMTPNQLINAARLKKAAELLLITDCQVLEIVKMVGFNSRSNFGKAFFKKFKVTPTVYQQLEKAFRPLQGNFYQ